MVGFGNSNTLKQKKAASSAIIAMINISVRTSSFFSIPTRYIEGKQEMERETRFELATSTLATWGSTTELLPQRAGGGGFEPPRCTFVNSPPSKQDGASANSATPQKAGFLYVTRIAGNQYLYN